MTFKKKPEMNVMNFYILGTWITQLILLRQRFKRYLTKIQLFLLNWRVTGGLLEGYWNYVPPLTLLYAESISAWSNQGLVICLLSHLNQ